MLRLEISEKLWYLIDTKKRYESKSSNLTKIPENKKANI